MKKWEKKAIKEIMDNFDFSRVQTAMTALGWRYNNKRQVPSLRQIKETAMSALETACAHSAWSNGSGGFVVYSSQKHKVMELLFSVESWGYRKDEE